MKMEDENFESLTMECTNCHLKFYASDLKLDQKTNLMVCKNCFKFPGSKITIIKDRDMAKKKIQKTETKKEQLEKTTRREDRVISADQIAYMCQECKYYFTRKEGKFNGVCPYCGQQAVKRVKRN